MNQSRIFITGSNAGFGRLAVLTLAQQGHHVIATMRDPSKGEALLEEVFKRYRQVKSPSLVELGKNTYKRHRFPPDIISCAVWLYYRFNLSHRDTFYIDEAFVKINGVPWWGTCPPHTQCITEVSHLHRLPLWSSSDEY